MRLLNEALLGDKIGATLESLFEIHLLFLFYDNRQQKGHELPPREMYITKVSPMRNSRSTYLSIRRPSFLTSFTRKPFSSEFEVKR